MSKANSENYNSGSDNWETPSEIVQSILNLIEKERFCMDVCTTNLNIPALEHITVTGIFESTPFENHVIPVTFGNIGGLGYDWHGVCWMNPPWSKARHWVEKAVQEVERNNCEVWACLPVRTKEKCYQKNLLAKAGFIVFLEGRQKFILEGKSPEGGCPSDVMIAYFGENADKYAKLWKEKMPIAGVVYQKV